MYKKIITTTIASIFYMSSSVAESLETDKSSHTEITKDLVAQNTPLVENLFTERDPKAFELYYKQAVESKIIPQTLFEADFLYSVDTENNQRLIEIVKRHDTKKLVKGFNSLSSHVFATVDDFKAVLHFVDAVKHFENNDTQLFKKEIKEAFWFSPDQAPIFASLIEKTKLKAIIKDYTFPSNFKFQLQLTQKEIPNWKTIIPEQTALVIYCYSPWSNDCFELAEEVKAIHEICVDNKFAHLQHRLEIPDEADIDNARYTKAVGIDNSHAWTVETYKVCLLETLRIKQTPTLIVLNQEGKIQFHGNITKFKEFVLEKPTLAKE